MKRNKKVFDRWIANLRSGKFDQHKYSLHFVDESGHSTYCCLGVFCRTSTKVCATPVSKHVLAGERGRVSYRDLDGYRAEVFLTETMREHIGITVEECRLLTVANDNKASFDDIADMLESWKDTEV